MEHLGDMKTIETHMVSGLSNDIGLFVLFLVNGADEVNSTPKQVTSQLFSSSPLLPPSLLRQLLVPPLAWLPPPLGGH